YPNYEIVIIQMSERDKIAEPATNFPHHVLHFADVSNDSVAKNYAVAHTDSPWLLFLDENVQAIGPDWLTIMAEHVQRPATGAVGPRLVNSRGTIEHAGLVVGVNGIAQSAFRGFPAEHPGVNRQLQMTRNYSAISSACLLVRREVFQQIGGFDEKLSGALADVDLCLKMRRAGYLIVSTPLAKLCWDPSPSAGVDASAEVIMRQRWSDV